MFLLVLASMLFTVFCFYQAKYFNLDDFSFFFSQISEEFERELNKTILVQQFIYYRFLLIYLHQTQMLFIGKLEHGPWL